MTYEMELKDREYLGYMRGYIEGCIEGYIEAKESIATNLIRMNMPIETIQELTELSIDRILELEKKFMTNDPN
ncbi:MAG: hypothetical protein IJ575_10230 [Selenomonadaceae bacterium]|nr:hypothetical protein [Selenomonadaceae bacterium]